MAEVTLRWPTVRSNPIHPEHEERTYSGGRAAAEAIVALGHDVWINDKRVTPADAQRDLDIRARVKTDREAARAVREAKAAPERERLTQARRQAVAEVLLCQVSGIWKDRTERVPNLKRARAILADRGMSDLRHNMLADADQLIAAYEAAR